MQDYLISEWGLCFELIVGLAMGAAVLVGLAALAARAITSSVWRRTIWQVATLGLVALVAVELTGMGPALLGILHCGMSAPSTHLAGSTSVSVQTESDENVQPTLAVAADDVGPTPAESDAPTIGPFASSLESHFLPTTMKLAGVDWLQGWADSNPLRESTAVETNDGAEPPDVLPTPEESMLASQSVAAGSDEQAGARPMAMPVPESPQATVPAASESANSGGAWWLGAIWAFGAALIVGRIVLARVLLLVFRRRHAAPGDETVCRRVGLLARRLRIRRPVCVLEAPGLRAPVVFGCLRPTVTLPSRFTEEFDPRQQEAVLVHELAHLAAWDPAWQLVSDLLCAAMWWHPLAWWSRRRLRGASEAAADEASLLVPDGPDVLAGCLVAVGRRLARPRQLGWLSVEGSGFRSSPSFRSSLGRRVQRLLSLPKCGRPHPRRGRLALARTVLPVSLVIVAVLCTAWVRPRAALGEGETMMNVWTNAWRRSLAAVALAALVSPVSADTATDDSPIGESVAVVAGDQLAFQDREGGERERAEREERERREREPEGRQREAEERERREMNPEEAFHRHIGQLKERAEATERRLHEMGEDHPEREAVQNALREIQEQIEQAHRRFREAQRPRGEPDQRHREEAKARVNEMKEKHRHLQERAQEIKREMEGLGDGEDDRARALHEEFREVRENAQRLEREAQEVMREAGHRPGPPPELREKLKGRIEELKRKIGELSEAGRHDEAERLKQEGRKMVEQFHEQFGRPEPGPPGHPDDLQRRIEHVKAAIENLNAAGMHEPANRLAEHVERLINEHRERGGPPHEPGPPEHREGPPPGHPEGPPPGHPEGPPPGHPEQVIHELRGEVQQLRREMEELRDQIRRLLERQER